MAIRTLIVLLLLWLPRAQAYVTVLSTQWSEHCGQLLMHKSTKGIQLTLEGNDPTEQLPQTLSEEHYKLEALSGIEKVHEVYRGIFRQREMDPAEANKILEGFAIEDAKRLANRPNENGLENTVYFVWKDAAGTPHAVIRATLLRSYDNRRLPLESMVSIPKGNRVELERAYNARGPRAGVVSSEMMMVMARYFKDYFSGNEYDLYALTDALRARHYSSHYAFKSVAIPQTSDHLWYLTTQSGDTFYDRYIGHTEKAYNLAFSSTLYPFGMNEALAHLQKYAAMPGLHDYIPNLVAQSVIYSSHRDYAKAVEISEHLKEIGSAQINEDYLVLWRSRTLYDPFANQGDSQKALAIVDEYLKDHPLKLETYNDRALLFLIYRLKIYLGTEDMDSARALLLKHRDLLVSGRAKMQPYSWSSWTYVLNSRFNRFRPANRAHRLIAELLMDLSTSRDPFATPVLWYGTWNLLSLLEKEKGNETSSQHFRKIADVIAGTMGRN